MTNDIVGDLVAANTDPGDILSVLGYARQDWQRDALCREYPDVTWFPSKGQGAGPALTVCGNCLVLDECRRWAMADPTLDHGVLGGMSAPARTAARRLQQKRNPHATT